MPTRTGYAPGTPCWVDLLSPDVSASLAFYTELFGWASAPVHDPDGNRIYTLLKKDGYDTAGLSAQPPMMAGMPPVWNTYVATADADATSAAVEKAGGQVVMPAMTVLEVGTMAVCTDPTGAAFSIWQAGSHIGAQIVNEADAYSWNELLSGDVERAKSFYAEVFGWTYEGMDMGPDGTYWVIQGGESGGLGGMMGRPAQMPSYVPDHWAVYFIVADIDAKVATTTAAGGNVMHGPEDVPGIGRIATVTDPQGGAFSMLQPAPQG
jgi:predicted enzyme related to lactoylglutathione lyase